MSKQTSSQKQTDQFPCDSLKGGKAIAFLLFEEDTLRIVITGKRRTMQVIFAPVDISLFSQPALSRGRTASAKKKDADGLKRDIGIFVYDTFRRYIKHHYGVGIACALVGGDFPALSALCGFLEKESKVPMVVKSLTATRHFLEMSLARIQSERSTERTHIVKAPVHTRKIAHLTIPLVTLGVGCFLIVFSATVLGWYLFAPPDVVQKAEDLLSAGKTIERTFTIDFVADSSSHKTDNLLFGKQVILTQQKTVSVTPTGTETVRYPLSGTITVVNDSDNQISLRDHTRFAAANGVVVRTLEGVVITAGESQSVAVIADTSDVQELPAGRLAIVMFDNTVLDQKVYGYVPTPLFRAAPDVRNTMTEEDLAQARHALRIDLKKMLLEQVDWKRFISVDTGTLSLTQETVNPAGIREDLKTLPITLTATGRLLVSLVEKQDIERTFIESVSPLEAQPNIVSWKVKNFYYLPDTTKGMVTISALVRNSP